VKLESPTDIRSAKFPCMGFDLKRVVSQNINLRCDNLTNPGSPKRWKCAAKVPDDGRTIQMAEI
jgi:hypothetical protein